MIRMPFALYLRLLRTHTLVTQIATGAVTSSLGDTLAQHVVEGKTWSDHDWMRTGRFAVYSGLIFAPVANRWHALMNRIQFDSMPKTLIGRLIPDCLIFTPSATALFYYSMGTLEGRTMSDIQARLSENIIPLIKKQWMVFGPAVSLNFTVIPVYARPPFMNIVALFWMAYLASVNAVEVEGEGSDEEKAERERKSRENEGVSVSAT